MSVRKIANLPPTDRLRNALDQIFKGHEAVLSTGVVSVSYTPNFIADALAGSTFDMTLMGDLDLRNPVGLKQGQVITYRLKNGNGLANGLVLDSLFRMPNGVVSLVLSSTLGWKDVLAAKWDATEGKLDVVAFLHYAA